ncbi:hypothetical protein EMIHUDRAFT_122807, partial [Emiliania huxleyi CCMP1516]
GGSSTDSSDSSGSGSGSGSTSGGSGGNADSDSGDSSLRGLVLTQQAKTQLGVVLVSSALLQLGIGMIVPILPAYASSVGLTEAHVGVPIGQLADVLGRKPPWVGGAIVDGVGCIATACAGGLGSMVSARLLMGAGSAVGGSAATAYAMDVLSLYPKHKGRLLGALNAAGALAWILGPALGGFLAERAGIGLPFVLVGGILLATAPAIHWLLPETQPPAPGTSVASLRFRALLDGTQRSFGALARDRNQQALMLMQCALFTGWSCSLTVLPLYAAATHGASPAELGTLYSVSSALGVLGAPLGGAAADALGRVPAVSLGGGMLVASFASLAAVDSQLHLLGTMAALGFGEAFLMSSIAALANDVTPPHLRGAQSALLAQVGDVTFVAMPIALSLLATTASHESAFLASAGLIAGASAGFRTLARPCKPRHG